VKTDRQKLGLERLTGELFKHIRDIPWQWLGVRESPAILL
jgi:hypothetical protein